MSKDNTCYRLLRRWLIRAVVGLVVAVALSWLILGDPFDIPKRLFGPRFQGRSSPSWRAEMIRRMSKYPTTFRMAGSAPWYPPEREAIPVIRVLLHDWNRDIRLQAIEWLTDLKEDARLALPDIIAALRDSDPRVRYAAADLLGTLGPTHDGTAVVLRERLNDPDLMVRICTARAYHKVTGDADLPAGIVIPLLRENDMEGPAVSALIEFGPAAREAVPVLVAMFNENRPFRYLTPNLLAIALGRIGPAAREAKPCLRQALRDEQSRVRLTSAVALWRIGDRDRAILAVIRTVLQEEAMKEDDFLVLAALLDIGEHHDLAKLLHADIRQLHDHSDSDVIRKCCRQVLDFSRSATDGADRKPWRHKMLRELSPAVAFFLRY